MADEATGQEERGKKRRRLEAVTEFSMDTPTVEELAEPFLAATAEIPFSALTCRWKTGFNRPISSKHVMKLCRSFETESVRRGVEANFLAVQCDSKAIAQMLQHLGSESGSDGDRKAVVSFSEWARVNPGVTLEVMTGQHRMEALRLHVRRTGAKEEAELWWTCKVYSDTLPSDLDDQLRMNRQDVMLADGHGEIWSQIVQAADRDRTLFEGSKATTMTRLRVELQLGGDFHFPVDRVVTLWNNVGWREMLRRWSETAVGRGNFSVYMFDWMASLRIDGYWLGFFESALQTLHGFPEGAGQTIRTQDWETFVQKAQNREGWEGWDAYFFPAADSAESSTEEGRRRRGFLSNMRDGTYEAILAHVKENPSLEFADVGWLRKISRNRGQILAKIVSHVVDWLNPCATIVIHQQRSNKPQLREDFRPALSAYHQRRGTEAAGLESQVEHGSLWIECAVIEAAWEHMAFFTCEKGKVTLEKRYRGEDDGYAARFAHRAWGAILRTVEQAFEGDGMSPLPWESALVCSGGGCEEGHNTPKAAALDAVTLVVESVRRSNPMANTTLGSEAALQTLSAMLSDTVRRWADAGAKGEELHASEAADAYAGDSPWNDGGSDGRSVSLDGDQEQLSEAMEEPGPQSRDKDGECPLVERGAKAAPSIWPRHTDMQGDAVSAETQTGLSQARDKLIVPAQATRPQNDSRGSDSDPSASTTAPIREHVPGQSAKRYQFTANSPMAISNHRQSLQLADFRQQGQGALQSPQQQLEWEQRIEWERRLRVYYCLL